MTVRRALTVLIGCLMAGAAVGTVVVWGLGTYAPAFVVSQPGLYFEAGDPAPGGPP